MLLAAGPSQALGIDTLQNIFPSNEGRPLENAAGAATKKKLQEAEDSFQGSDLLKRLKEQTTSNARKSVALVHAEFVQYMQVKFT